MSSVVPVAVQREIFLRTEKIWVKMQYQKDLETKEVKVVHRREVEEEEEEEKNVRDKNVKPAPWRLFECKVSAVIPEEVDESDEQAMLMYNVLTLPPEIMQMIYDWKVRFCFNKCNK